MPVEICSREVEKNAKTSNEKGEERVQSYRPDIRSKKDHQSTVRAHLESAYHNGLAKGG